MRRAFALAAVAFGLAVGGLITPAVAPASPVDAATPRQLALGISSLPFDDMNNVDAHTAALGRPPALWSVWSDWGRSNGGFPWSTLLGLRARGIVPLVIWEPVVPPATVFNWQDVVNGVYDSYIRSWASAARNWGGTIILRFAHEMDGTWFPWGSGHGSNTPALFVAGWQHVWNIFKGPGGVGAYNVKFLWSPNVPKAEYFPGNSYIDFAGFSAFNWAKNGSWTSMGTYLNIRAGRARKITKKPIIVAELGSNSTPGNKASWITTGYNNAYNNYPQIAAIVYFDVNMQPGQPDWRLITPPAAQTAYANLLKSTKFQGTLVQPRVTVTLPATVVTPSPDPVTVNLGLTASDAYGAGITHWYVSTSPTTPLITDPNWTTAPPTTWQLSAGFGSQTVYAWVYDLNGIISPTGQATTIRRSTTSTSVNSNINPSTFGQGVTFTATITSPAGTVNSGTVDFKSDGVDIVGCTARPVASGSATCGPITALATASHPITAYFSGGTIFAASNSAASPYSQSVGQATTSTSVISNINPSTYHQGVTFTATISSTGGTVGGGTVQFKSDGSNITGCTAQPVASGKATCGPISGLAVSSSHPIVAYFSGTTNFALSDSSASPYSQVVSKATTTTSVHSDVNPSTIGQSVTFTATVSSTAGTIAGGTVKFQVDGSDVGCNTQPVTAGSATCGPISNIAVGASHQVTAYFSGSTNFAKSDNSATPYSQAVSQASTTTSVVPDINPSTFGQTVTFTATISSTGGTVGDGNVKFQSDGVDIPSCSSQPVSSGSATCATSSLTAGSHNITAYFSGSTNFANSDNSTTALQQTVNQAGTMASVISDTNPAAIDQHVNLTATISSTAGTVGEGKVEFKSDGTDIVGCEQVSVTAGSAMCDFQVGNVGSDITVYFSGSTDFANSDNSATPYTQDVN